MPQLASDKELLKVSFSELSQSLEDTVLGKYVKDRLNILEDQSFEESFSIEESVLWWEEWVFMLDA